MNQKLVQEKFGASAEAYATSAVHSRGASLELLMQHLTLKPEWRVLDVATAAGHTAHAIAPHVTQVIAADITWPMLQVAAQQAQQKGIFNVNLAAADAHKIPFLASSFDLVTCRLAAHHFTALDLFMSEVARILKPGGQLAIVDNIVPGSLLRGKKAQRQRDAGRYINAFEALRDPSHGRCLSLDEWRQQFYQAGFQISHEETISKNMDFNKWVARMKVSPADTVRLRVMLKQAPLEVADFLAPGFEGDVVTMRLTEVLMIGRLPFDGPSTP